MIVIVIDITMKGISKARYANKGESTIEVSIPQILVQYFNIKAGDQIEWESSGIDMKVRKVKP